MRPQPACRRSAGKRSWRSAIGPDLEEASASCAAKGELVDALLLDAVGSAAAEAAADSLNLALAHHGAGVAGYGSWDVDFQRRLLALLRRSTSESP